MQVSESFLQFKGHAPPPRLAAVLTFLLELLRRNGDSDPALLALPLPPLLRCVMLVNEPQVRKTSTDALQLVVERCAAASTAGPCGHVMNVLRQVYGVLETVSVLDRPLVQALLPHLTLSLRNTERKRGLGRNAALRRVARRSSPRDETISVGKVFCVLY
ncbi:Protein MMS22-like [Liparis tanakae]|uniref:Protein MMS22-like n=1 Tax=Liparis tanakae TaxID=230148 RepID=A0A4Z2HH50_9TELE|nr:Protein MMS22-like [Liparis tanakae]